MNDSRSLRIGAWSGVVFSVLSLIVLPLAVPPPPPLGVASSVFVAWFSAHRWPFLVGNFLGIAAFIPGFVQLAVIGARVRRAEGPDGWLASLVLTSGTFGYAVFACSLVVFQVLPFLAAPRLEQSMEGFSTFAMVWFALDGLAALPVVLALTWAASATGVLPRWFIRFGFVTAAAVAAMSLGSFTTEPLLLAAGGPLTALGFVMFFAWTGALSVAMFRLARDRASAQRPA